MGKYEKGAVISLIAGGFAFLLASIVSFNFYLTIVLWTVVTIAGIVLLYVAYHLPQEVYKRTRKQDKKPPDG